MQAGQREAAKSSTPSRLRLRPICGRRVDETGSTLIRVSVLRFVSVQPALRASDGAV